MKREKRMYNDFDDTINEKKRVFCTNCQQWLPLSNTVHTCYSFHDSQIARFESVPTGMTKGQLCQLLEDEAKVYLKDINASIKRNGHMFSFRGKIDKQQAIATLVDYINTVASGQGLDLGLLEKHLTTKGKKCP